MRSPKFFTFAAAYPFAHRLNDYFENRKFVFKLFLYTLQFFAIQCKKCIFRCYHRTICSFPFLHSALLLLYHNSCELDLPEVLHQ